MPSVRRTVTTSAPVDRVFAYLADFSNSTEWDSGTQRCERTSGDGGPGTVYRNVSKFLGREVTLDYTVERVEQPVFKIVGRADGTTSVDTITVEAKDGRTSVDYLAEFTFSGPARFLGVVMKPALNHLANETEKTLSAALERL